jgi:hypothetical protein
MPDKILSRQRHQLALGRMVYRFPADNLQAQRRAVLLHIVMKIIQRLVRSSGQHLLDAQQSITDFGKELVLGANTAAMLPGVVDVCRYFPGLNLVGIKLQNLGLVMINENDGVEKRHD